MRWSVIKYSTLPLTTCWQDHQIKPTTTKNTGYPAITSPERGDINYPTKNRNVHKTTQLLDHQKRTNSQAALSNWTLKQTWQPTGHIMKFGEAARPQHQNWTTQQTNKQITWLGESVKNHQKTEHKLDTSLARLYRIERGSTSSWKLSARSRYHQADHLMGEQPNPIAKTEH